MRKIKPRKNDKNLFGFFTDYDLCLFSFGDSTTGDLYVGKMSNRNKCICNQTNNFEYNGETNVLRGSNDYYNPKRILVIQMN